MRNYKNIDLFSESKITKKTIYGLDLDKKYIENKELLFIAVPYMDKIQSIIENISPFSFITDREGCILNLTCHKKIVKSLNRAGYVNGAYVSPNTYSKTYISIEENELIILGIPIEMKSNLQGVFNIAFYKEEVEKYNALVLEIISSNLTQIMEANELNSHLTTNNNFIDNILNCMPLGLIVLDIKDKVIKLNNISIEVFGDKLIPNTYLGTENNIVEEYEIIKKTILVNGEYIGDSRLITQDGNINVEMVGNIIYDGLNSEPNIVLLFKKLKGKKQRNFKYECEDNYTFEDIIGENSKFIKIINYAKKVADRKSPLLIIGEVGSGKSMLAQSIHNFGSRMDEPFVKISCASIPSQLLGCELFGFGKSIGKLQSADKGTLIINFIEYMPEDIQMRLVEYLDSGNIRRIDNSEEIKVDVRIIATTSKHLISEGKDESIRKELYYRISILSIDLPPLRERIDDIPFLVDYFVKKLNNSQDKSNWINLSHYMNGFIKYEWPGNIRELKGVIENLIKNGYIPSNLLIDNGEDIDINDDELRLDFVEKRHIVNVLRKFNGNISHTANALGINRGTLYVKMKKYEIT